MSGGDPMKPANPDVTLTYDGALRDADADPEALPGLTLPLSTIFED